MDGFLSTGRGEIRATLWSIHGQRFAHFRVFSVLCAPKDSISSLFSTRRESSTPAASTISPVPATIRRVPAPQRINQVRAQSSACGRVPTLCIGEIGVTSEQAVIHARSQHAFSPRAPIAGHHPPSALLLRKTVLTRSISV